MDSFRAGALQDTFQVTDEDNVPRSCWLEGSIASVPQNHRRPYRTMSPVSCLTPLQEEGYRDSDSDPCPDSDQDQAGVHRRPVRRRRFAPYVGLTRMKNIFVDSAGPEALRRPKRSLDCITPIGKAFRISWSCECPGAPLKKQAMPRRTHSENLQRLMTPLKFESASNFMQIAVL